MPPRASRANKSRTSSAVELSHQSGSRCVEKAVTCSGRVDRGGPDGELAATAL